MTENSTQFSLKDTMIDLRAGVVVMLVALPLCLGIALASGAPLASGILSGIIGGLVVGALSGSKTSVSGPAAGLAAIVGAQIVALGSFEAFLVAVIMAGVIQVGMGIFRAGFIAAFFPSAVIKGLLAAIGVLLILKQIPHVFGHDPDPVGEMAFSQPDGQNTFSEIFETMLDLHFGAAAVGIIALIILVAWQRVSFLKNSGVPAPLVVVGFGVAANEGLKFLGEGWVINAEHLVSVPVSPQGPSIMSLLRFPDWSIISNPAVFTAAATIAVVASLETLLNLEAVDKIDPEQRHSPPNRELIAQGAGNIIAGFIGGLPMTSVIVRSSVNVNAGARSRISAIFHGILLLGAAVAVPSIINLIPLSCLAAILLVTGFKLASPKLFRQLYREGRTQFVPFVITVGAIVFIDLLSGIIIGLIVAVGFILQSSFKRPLRRIMEHHASEDVLRVELASQVGFFSRPALVKTLEGLRPGGHVLLDARNTEFIDADIIDLIEDFKTTGAPARDISVSLLGFKDHYGPLSDEIQFVDFASRDLQENLTPDNVIAILKEGHERFMTGKSLTRNLKRQVQATAKTQAPMAVVLGCIDSRTVAEHVFDLGIGDIFAVRVAGNIGKGRALGSLEYACGVNQAKVIVVMGHTACGAVKAAVELHRDKKSVLDTIGCEHLDALVQEIQESLRDETFEGADTEESFAALVDRVSEENVKHSVEMIRSGSPAIAKLEKDGDVRIVGAMYDVRTGALKFLE